MGKHLVLCRTLTNFDERVQINVNMHHARLCVKSFMFVFSSFHILLKYSIQFLYTSGQSVSIMLSSGSLPFHWVLLYTVFTKTLPDFFCKLLPDLNKKTLFWGFKVIQGRRSWYPPESSSGVLVMIRSKSVSICNHSRVRLVDSSRNRTFHGGTQIWFARTEDSLNLGVKPYTVEIHV